LTKYEKCGKDQKNPFMIHKIFKAFNLILDYVLTIALVVVISSFGYWFVLQSQAQNTYSNPTVTFQSVKSKITPSIADGVSDKKNINNLSTNETGGKFEKSTFKDTACSSTSKKDTVKAEIPDFDNEGLFSVSKDKIKLKYSDQNTFIYGQDLLDQNLIDYMLCVIDTTASTTALNLQLDFPYQNQEYLLSPTRIIIYDNLEDYTNFFKEAYGQKLGDTVPWGLSESQTISTFLRMKKSDQALTDYEISDIKYRLTYNLSHEYFHHIFSLFRPVYTPFIEEGLAVYISSRVTNQLLGYHVGCSFRLTQANLAAGKPVDLSKIELATNPDKWYNSNNVSQNYALSFYYIKYLESSKVLIPFVHNFLNDPEFLKSGTDSSKLNPAFKGKLEKMLAQDQFDCGYSESY